MRFLIGGKERVINDEKVRIIIGGKERFKNERIKNGGDERIINGEKSEL